jgi:hypothetical protein
MSRTFRLKDSFEAVTLSVAKGLAQLSEMLRFAQHDKRKFKEIER